MMMRINLNKTVLHINSLTKEYNKTRTFAARAIVFGFNKGKGFFVVVSLLRFVAACTRVRQPVC